MSEKQDSRPVIWQHIHSVNGFLSRVVVNVLGRMQKHDQSKLVTPEVEFFDRNVHKLKSLTYGSDEYKACLLDMSAGLKRHYSCNSHHPEFFALNDSSGDVDSLDADGNIDPAKLSSGRAIRKMSLLDLTEMLSDWKAASMQHENGDIRKSIDINQKRFGYSDELKQILLNTLPALELP
jgi:hypothetical protein